MKGGKFGEKKEAWMGHLRHGTVDKGLFMPKNTYNLHAHTLTHIRTYKSQATFQQAPSFSTTITAGFD